LRRRPALVVASIAAVLLGALVSVWLYTSSSVTEPVLATRVTIERGQQITSGDLVTVRISVDPALHPVAAADLAKVVGKRAALDMPAGGVVTSDAMADSLTPPAGKSVVGLALTSAMMPSGQLRPGDNVRVVYTPGASGDLPVVDPETIAAQVVSVVTSTTGSAASVVNLQVDSSKAALVAAAAATGKVALILDSQEH